VAKLVSARQFDVFPNPDGSDTSRPLIVIVQSDAIAHLRTRVVMPLMEPGTIRLAGRLTPRLEVAGRRMILSGSEVATIDSALLRDRIDNLEPDRDRILGATDILLFGI